MSLSRRARAQRFPGLVLGLLAVAAAAAGGDAHGVFRRYVVPTSDSGVAAVALGDFDVWFTESSANKIGRLDLRDGSIQEFDVPTPDAGLAGIATSTFSGALEIWFTESRANKIGRMRTDGSVEEFAVPTPGAEPWGIASDFISGEIWFTERAGNKLGRIAPDGTIEEFPIPTPGSGPTGVALPFGPFGPDVAFTESHGNAIGIRSAATGAIQELPIPTPASEPTGIALAADGTLWFTERAGAKIGRVVAGEIEEFALASGSQPTGIAANVFGGGFVWFTATGSNRVGFIDQDGRVTEYPVPVPLGIATDGNRAWFATPGANEILRVEQDVAVIAGFGPAGTWVSRLDAANGETRPHTAFASYYPYPPTICPSVGCLGIEWFDLPVLGTGSFFGFGGFGTVFSRTGSGELPSFHARYTNTARPTQAADAPVVRLSTISSLDPQVLSFPSAARSFRAQSNLFLSNPAGDGPVSGLIEVFSPDGESLRTESFEVPAYSLLTVPDVVSRLGGPDVENAQVRVTKLGGTGLLWGSLATVRGDEGTLSVSMGSNFSRALGDVLIVPAAGTVGTWDTDFELANPTSQILAGRIFTSATWPDPCLGDCASVRYSIPPNGTFQARASDFMAGVPGSRVVRIEADEGIVPVAHVRVINRAGVTQAAELPVVASGWLQQIASGELLFASASRGAGVRGNLFLAAIGATPGAGMKVLIDAHAADGSLVGSSPFTIPPDRASTGLTIPDVLGRLGISSLENGQIRVTKISGSGFLWGVLSTVSDEGWLSVSEGVNP